MHGSCDAVADHVLLTFDRGQDREHRGSKVKFTPVSNTSPVTSAACNNMVSPQAQFSQANIL